MTITKSVSITSTSVTAEGQAIAYFSANVSGNGTSSNMAVQNQDLYEANKVQVRKDKSDFDNAVYEVEDEQSSKATTAG
ncbi:hypothetical protein WL797_07935 [Leuconostoc mesenteroides]|uniref:hypothetical protein n=1 Tax=Leuconostoc mesenteroides TaxID=1245 RepID=UPI00311D5DB0